MTIRTALLAVSLAIGPVAGGELPNTAVDAVFGDLDSVNSPGCAVGVMREGRFVYRAGYGMASLEHGAPTTPDTVFYVGSVSKQFVAASIALAAEDGKLSLEDDVRNHVRELPDYGERITIRHLVHHSSGLRDYLGLLRLAGKPAEDVISDEEVLALIARQKALNFPPGSQYRYSNSGYFLLAEIINRTTGKTLREFAAREIFGPLGMDNSHFHDDRSQIVRRRATAYSPVTGGGFRLNWSSNFDKVGSGGLMTTVTDMLAWERNFLDARIGSIGFLETILTPGRLRDDTEQDYAFGLQIGEYRGLPTVSHGGSMFGFRAFLSIARRRLREPLPEKDFGHTLGTTARIGVRDIAQTQHRKTFLGEAQIEGAGSPSAESPKVSKDSSWQPSASELAQLAGRYYSPELDAYYTFELTDGVLHFAGLKTMPATKLQPESQSRFRAGQITFQFDPKGLLIDAGRVAGIRFERVKARSLTE